MFGLERSDTVISPVCKSMCSVVPGEVGDGMLIWVETEEPEAVEEDRVVLGADGDILDTVVVTTGGGGGGDAGIGFLLILCMV